jgi:hypothetical protein
MFRQFHHRTARAFPPPGEEFFEWPLHSRRSESAWPVLMPEGRLRDPADFITAGSSVGINQPE